MYYTFSGYAARTTLEKQLGQLLLIRARPCTLTPAGQQLFEHLQHTRLLEQNLMHTLAGPQNASFFKPSLPPTPIRFRHGYCLHYMRCLFKKKYCYNCGLMISHTPIHGYKKALSVAVFRWKVTP